MFKKMGHNKIINLILVLMLVFTLNLVLAGLSFAEESIIVEDVYIPLSDGINTAAKVYRPAGEEKYPVLLSRTPYGSGAFKGYEGRYGDVGHMFAEKGYVVVVQDVRGLYASEGDYIPYATEEKDGYDSVVWCTQQPWSNGSVGTFGASAMGIHQNQLVAANPPGLKTMFVIVAPSKYFEEGLFPGGAYRLELIQRWIVSQNAARAQKLYGMGQITREEYENIAAFSSKFPENYEYTPLKQFPFFGILDDYYADFFNHYVKDGFFDFRDVSLDWPNINIPIYNVGGWYDIYAEGNITNFNGINKEGGPNAKGNQKLLMGPWSHRNIGNSGDYQGDEININDEMLRWFDYWLKGIDNGIMDEPPIKYFDTGTCEWKTAKKWPIPGVTQKKMYLDGKTSGSTNSLNDGSLSDKMPPPEPVSESVYDEFIYDPANPTKTIGGRNLYIDSGPKDQRPSEHNILTYTSEILDKDINISGLINTTLYISSSEKDTDFAVKLTDVAQEGTSILIADGISRARFREGLDKEVFMEPGKIYELVVNLGNNCHTFKAGHRIRVDISSSNFPRFDRNTNTGNPWGVDGVNDFKTAVNRVYHSPRYSSHISLPVVN